MRLPCIYGDLAGTSWYNRLIAAEFDIRFDHYPARETLIDSRCPPELRAGRRWEEYREVLLTLRSHPDKDTMTPLDFLSAVPKSPATDISGNSQGGAFTAEYSILYRVSEPWLVLFCIQCIEIGQHYLESP